MWPAMFSENPPLARIRKAQASACSSVRSGTGGMIDGDQASSPPLRGSAGAVPPPSCVVWPGVFCAAVFWVAVIRPPGPYVGFLLIIGGWLGQTRACAILYR